MTDEVRVLVYSSDSTTRAQVTTALGTALYLPTEPDRPRPLAYVEAATQAAVLAHLDAGTIDLAILDGEASPSGGMGIAKQLKDEIDPCPPIVVLIGRPADDWLANWSRAEAVVAHPIDPIALGDAVAALLA